MIKDYLITMVWSDRTRMFHMNESTRKQAIRQAEQLWLDDKTLTGIEVICKQGGSNE